MGTRRGSGSSIKGMIQEELASRQTAEKIHEVVGADQRLAEVRYGNFAEDGVIDPDALQNGSSPNLLPARWAEYEGFAVGEEYVTDTPAVSTIESYQGFKYLLTDSSTNPVANHNIYPDKLSGWTEVTDGQTYIYSTTAISTGAATKYVGLKVQAADTAGGVNNVTLFATPDNTTAMTNVTGVGKQVRIYAKFTVPAGKPFVKVQHRVLYDATTRYIGWNWNMLELVSDFRSFPSKYAAPTPRAGELSPEQLGFDAGANVLPYSKASLAVYEGDITLSSIAQGTVVGTHNGYGYYFLTTDDNTWRGPSTNMGATSTFVVDRLIPGDLYMASLYTTNLGSENIRVQVRVGTADNVTDINAKSGTWEVKGTSAEVVLLPGESKRISVKWTHDAISGNPATGAIGPRIEVKGRRSSGVGSAQELRIDNYMVEPASTNTLYPSKYVLPTIGRNELTFGQIEVQAATQARSSATQNIGNGVTATLNLDDPDFDYNFGGNQDYASTNRIRVYRKGLYLITFNVDWTLSGTSGNNRLVLYVRLTSNGVNTDYTVGSQIAPAISGDGSINGSIIRPLRGSEDTTLRHDVSLRALNSSESALRTVDKVRLGLTYLGDNEQ